MHILAIVNLLAALLVVAYSVFRVHVLQWTVSPVEMVSQIITSLGSVLIAVQAAHGHPPGIGTTLIHAGFALNCIANWSRTRFDPCGKRYVRFIL